MKKVTEGVAFIKGQDEFIPDSHVYVIGMPDSQDLSVVDAGLMGKGRYKAESMQKLGVDFTHIKRIIMTHTHLDHIGCLREILGETPNAEIWMHREEAEPLERGDERIAYGMGMFKSMCQSQYELKEGDFTLKADRALEGGEDLKIGGMTWHVLHIPGHSPGSIALYDPDERVLIPGDVIYSDFAIGRYDLHGASGAQLKESLLRLADLDVAVLLPGHNRIETDLSENYIRETANQWGGYLT